MEDVVFLSGYAEAILREYKPMKIGHGLRTKGVLGICPLDANTAHWSEIFPGLGLLCLGGHIKIGTGMWELC